MIAEVVNLRSSPALTDIVGQLRQLADEIEQGKHDDVESVFVLIPRVDDYPTVFGWGCVTGMSDPIIQCELAKTWFLTQVTSR
jgi:hypothetical protein